MNPEEFAKRYWRRQAEEEAVSILDEMNMHYTMIEIEEDGAVYVDGVYYKKVKVESWKEFYSTIQAIEPE